MQALREDCPRWGERGRGAVTRGQVGGKWRQGQTEDFEQEKFLHTVNFLKIMVFMGFETIGSYKTKQWGKIHSTSNSSLF